MHNPIISIIVPCYNVESLLPKCVDTILQQTYSNWECILVDDGAKDTTPQVCDELVRIDNRIKVIHKSNGGLVSARNAGYDVATGEWITYVDGDDWVSTNFVEKITNAIVKHEGLDLIFFCAIQKLGDKTIEGKWNWEQYEDGKVYNKVENQRLSAYVLNYNSGISDVWAKAYRTEWCRQHDIKHNPVLKQGEESVDFVMRAFYYAEKSLFINECLYYYRYNANSISKRVDERNALYIADCMHVIAEFINTVQNNADFRKEFDMRKAYILIHIAMHTYFTPQFNLPYKERVARFEKFVANNKLFTKAISEVKCTDFDKLRMIALWSIQHKLYHILDFVGWVKQIVLRMGGFKY